MHRSGARSLAIDPRMAVERPPFVPPFQVGPQREGGRRPLLLG